MHIMHNTYEVRFELTDTFFCLTKYKLGRTTEFTRICVTNISSKYSVITHMHTVLASILLLLSNNNNKYS